MSSTAATPASTSATAISCRSCRAKKIRCDKSQPTCNKCAAVGAECVYLPRRQRAARPRSVVVDEPTIRDILRRLDALERLQPGGMSRNRSMSTHNEEMSMSRSSSEAPDPDPMANLSHLYSEATAVARSILPNSELLQTLDTVQANIENFRLKPRQSESSSSVHITETQAHRWITAFFNARFPVLTLPAVLSEEFMHQIPNLLQNPHVTISTAAQIVYYNILFQGMMLADIGPFPGRQAYSKYLYLRALSLVEAWTSSSTPTLLDFSAALLMMWMACEFLDTNLGWKFLSRSYQIGLALHLHEPSATTSPAETALWWHVRQNDIIFQQQFSKPPIIPPGTWNTPEPVMSPVAADEICFYIGMKTTDLLSNHLTTSPQTVEDGIRTHLAEWQLQERFETTTEPWQKWVYADTLFNTHTTFQLLHPRDSTGTNPTARRAARDSVHLLKIMTEGYPLHSHWNMGFVSYYPFISFFTLFYGVIEGVEGALGDLELMRWVASVLEVWERERVELRPLEKIAKALTRVAESIVESRGEEEVRWDPGAMGADGTGGWEDFLEDPGKYARVLELELFQKDPHEDWWDGI